MNQVQPSTAGSLIFNEADNDLYVWGTDAWKKSTSFNKVENEIFLEDNSFLFISMKTGASDYKVIRYDKGNINTESFSEGTGPQPTDLISVQTLIYN